MYVPECVASHLGAWACEPSRLRAAVQAAKDRLLPMRQSVQRVEGGVSFQTAPEGVAIVGLDGVMMKGPSKFDGTVSTAMVRRTLRQLAGDDQVRAILLRVFSPGGYVDGTADLAADVAAVAERKPIEAFIEDMGASAAYWVACQAEKVWANATALVGSIGTYQVLWDQSKQFEAEGIRVHVISTGALKGAGEPGTEITPDVLEYETRLVKDLNAHFLAGVRKGRGMTPKQVEAVATGEVWIAAKAKELGLVDGISTMDAVLERLAARGSKGSTARPRRALAAYRVQRA
ncbi:MAG: S49 family peptidase [Planctomycetes bacterium]|nr:S49 family peptidase [Planctomycetota bacterium]